VSYRLGGRAIATRARATAAIDLAMAIAPIALVIVLLHRLGYALTAWLWAVVAGLVALAATRAAVGYRALVRRLGAFVVTADAEHVVVETSRARIDVGRDAVQRIVDVEGPLGGLRLQLVPQPESSPLPDRIDLPRGGEGFGDLRAQLAQWRAVERAGKRGRAARIALGVAVVVGIFFLPFVFEDFVARSRGLALVLVLGLWLAMRFASSAHRR
jgi:hypothetical protein